MVLLDGEMSQMMDNFDQNKHWSDQFLPEIKGILGLHLIGEPPIEEDLSHNTDLIVLKMEPVRIACRIRRNSYSDYYSDFTIRAVLPSGGKTELSKIVEGWGDYIFYGHDEGSGNLKAWAIGDLNIFRLWFTTYLAKNKGCLPGILKKNHDLSSNFYVYKWKELPINFIIAKYGIN